VRGSCDGVFNKVGLLLIDVDNQMVKHNLCSRLYEVPKSGGIRNELKNKM
jgi:hypothetical protein